MPGQRKRYSVIDNLVLSTDRTEFCCKVKLVKDEDNTTDGYLAIVVHGDKNVTITETQESCLIFFEETKDTPMPPIVLKTFPICSDLNFEIAQLNNTSDLMVTFLMKQDSARVIFPNKDTMLELLSDLKLTKSLAEKCKLEASFEWTKTYSQLKIERNERKPVRSNSLPVNDENPASALRYVLPIQRAETIAKINLKRTRTVNVARERNVNLENAKKHWINYQLTNREDEFVDWQKTNAFVGTWNCHGSVPDANLKLWLQGTLKADDGTAIDPDFYILGLQEMETSAEAYLRYDPTKQNAWVKTVLESLKDYGNDYYCVDSKQLVTMLLIVIAKKRHRQFISEVSSTCVGVGLMSMGNKGGIAVRLKFHDSYLCFVTSHLAAFTDKIEKRNLDFAEIAKRLSFPHRQDPLTKYVFYSWNNGGDEGVSFLDYHNVKKDWKSEASIFHNDFLVWCGDLNYRVNLHETTVKNMLRDNKLDELLDYDQLNIERDAGRTFPMFDEGEITFYPTYKYDPGTNRYDTSIKRRTPSWTDRILWKKDRLDAKKQSLTLKSYSDCMAMMNSDHKPVRALLELNVRKIDSQLQKKTRENLVQQLKDHQDDQPRGDLSSSFVDFEKVQFMEYKEKLILLENTGQVLTVFKFMPKGEEDDTILPPWLQVSPLFGVLAPGEKVVIRFEITIDPTISAPLNRGEQTLHEILILRLENSKDFFISVDGDYVKTCFGVPLEQLSEVPVPISEAAAKNLQMQNTGSPPSSPVPLLNQINLPKQLWKLMNFLWNPSMFSIESLFLEHGDLIVSTYIKKCLDDQEQFDTNILLGGQPSANYENSDDESELTLVSEEDKSKKEAISANSMIDVLVAFLECLPEPVVPTNMYERALEAAETTEAMNSLKDAIPPFHRNVLLYISMFLRHAIDLSPDSCRNDRERKIIETFTVLLRPPFDFKERNPVAAKEQREKFISNLLKSLT